ncbi:MAG: hypothetical protein Q9211_003221 [Gyalolechia sp. 1 TL-2023]
MTSSHPTRQRVFLDVQSDVDFYGRIIIELFNDKAPKTCENFRSICTSSYILESAAAPLTYKGSPFHRIIDEFMIQGGDITAGNGTGGASIYGDNFDDENLGWRGIDAAGLLCMANRGRDTNSSQFFITLAPCEHLNGKHTVFGHVVKGMDVCERMAKVPVDKKDQPLSGVIVSHCGELERRPKQAAIPLVPVGETAKELHRSKERKNGRPRQSSSLSATSRHGSQSSTRRHTQRKRSQTPRRRSDQGLDENRRGRTSTRSISPHDRLPKSRSRHRQGRKRSLRPSRSRSPRGSRPPRLRRRSTERDRSPQYGGSSGPREPDPKAKHNQKWKFEHQDRQNGLDSQGKYNDHFRDKAREHNWVGRCDDERLEGGGDEVEGSGIKFKGRGSMKYRERMW